MRAPFYHFSRARKPVIFWSRDIDPAATPSVLPKPPFEARGVDSIMKLRKTMPGGGDAEVTNSNSTSRAEGVEAEAETTKSIQDRLEGQRPKDIKAWLDFRVSWLRNRVAQLVGGTIFWHQKIASGRLTTRNLADYIGARTTIPIDAVWLKRSTSINI